MKAEGLLQEERDAKETSQGVRDRLGRQTGEGDLSLCPLKKKRTVKAHSGRAVVHACIRGAFHPFRSFGTLILSFEIKQSGRPTTVNIKKKAFLWGDNQ